ncbi:Re/Si-specific NAD(P)(+) transhydrogenase subunit alpha [Sphingobacteriales bacterium UPWRP_1]|nr:NAD(P) transhydrogenase subunit alpha [Sphingobacteriales bacterium TSM_CSM]PSJ78412.1 Re/Si-specific NAD(P)(+) transhydrogenase subunit alpha [Sphingobacteriales bacterium UPWRP_1]
MTIGILKETGEEQRVVLLPETVKQLKGLQVAEILVEQEAGAGAFASDEDYRQAGATIAPASEIMQQADLLIRITPFSAGELEQIKPEAVLLSVFQPMTNIDLTNTLCRQGFTTFSLDLVPRTTRAQSMDILSSMATVAGYKAVLMAAMHLPKFFPMFMTAAGTITPAKVLVLGAGVAGLQAISTARRLGAVVEAFDVRTAVKEEVQSLGAKFVEVKGAAEDAKAGGYAVEQTEEYKQRQQELIQEHAIKSDVIIATAQIPGRRAPLLIAEETIAKMKPGSVIVDLAASTGGNCALTQNNQTIVCNGVTIIGQSNIPATVPADASKMFGKNVLNFLKLLIAKDGSLTLNFADDIVQGSCLTHNGQVVNERVKQIPGIIA